MKADITADFRRRYEHMSEKQLLIEQLCRLDEIAHVEDIRRQKSLTILPNGAPIRSTGVTVNNRLVVGQSFRVDYFLITTDTATSINIRIGSSRYGPFALNVGVNYIDLPFLILGGNEVLFAESTAGAAVITGYTVGTYVEA